MTRIYHDVTNESRRPIEGVLVQIDLYQHDASVGEGYQQTDQPRYEVTESWIRYTSDEGRWSIELTPTDDLAPAGSFYRATEYISGQGQKPVTYDFTVPAGRRTDLDDLDQEDQPLEHDLKEVIMAAPVSMAAAAEPAPQDAQYLVAEHRPPTKNMLVFQQSIAQSITAGFDEVGTGVLTQGEERIEVEVATDGDGIEQLTNAMPVVPGTKYTFSAYLENTYDAVPDGGEVVHLGIRWGDADMTYHPLTLPDEFGPDEKLHYLMERKSFTTTAPQGAYFATVQILNVGMVGSAVWFTKHWQFEKGQLTEWRPSSSAQLQPHSGKLPNALYVGLYPGRATDTSGAGRGLGGTWHSIQSHHGRSPAQHGLSGWSFDPLQAPDNTMAVLTTGKVYIVAIPNYENGANALSLVTHVKTLGAGFVGGQNWVGLYYTPEPVLDAEGHPVQGNGYPLRLQWKGSADTGFTTTGLKYKGFTTQVRDYYRAGHGVPELPIANALGTPFVYAALLFNATTPPALRAGVVSSLYSDLSGLGANVDYYDQGFLLAGSLPGTFTTLPDTIAITSGSGITPVTMPFVALAP